MENEDAGHELKKGIDCPFCVPREDNSVFWSKISSLSVSTLYLHKIQTYRGYSVLIFDPRHATQPCHLNAEEWAAFCSDLYLAQSAIDSIVKPDHMNVASLGNEISHLHWHIIPRYKGDSRWGYPIWMTTEEEMEIRHMSPEEHNVLMSEIRHRIVKG